MEYSTKRHILTVRKRIDLLQNQKLIPLLCSCTRYTMLIIYRIRTSEHYFVFDINSYIYLTSNFVRISCSKLPQKKKKKLIVYKSRNIQRNNVGRVHSDCV